MKVVFLDFDGVWVINNEVDFTCVKRLQTLAEMTGAKFVLSTDWRLQHTFEELKVWLGNFGLEVIGQTDSFRSTWKNLWMDDELEKMRSAEIRKWIEEHKPEKWISLDDLWLSEVCGVVNHIWCDPDKGFTENELRFAHEDLREENSVVSQD